MGMGIDQWSLGLSYDNFYNTAQKGTTSIKAMELHLQYRLRSNSMGLKANPGLRI